MSLEHDPNSHDPRALEPLIPASEFVWVPAPARRKFQHRYRIHILLFLLTLCTTSFHDAFDWLWLHPAGTNAFAAFTWGTFVSGLSYSIPLLIILGAHEFGHYIACRRYQVDATLPFFLPAPLPLTGTLGAVIRIREPFPSRKAIFDIGVAGPIAGFVMLLPFLVAGLLLSDVGPVPAGSLSFGDPLLFQWLYRLRFGAIPAGWDVMLHPIGFAAWLAAVITSINLLPYGQLDGGHVVYAAFGKRAVWISAATLVAIALLVTTSQHWIMIGVMLIAMGIFFGFRHPRPIDESQPIGTGRWIVAALTLVIFVLCFIPVPIKDTDEAPAAGRGRKIEVRLEEPRPVAAAGMPGHGGRIAP